VLCLSRNDWVGWNPWHGKRATRDKSIRSFNALLGVPIDFLSAICLSPFPEFLSSLAITLYP
jgi:hypothetical protein